MEPQSQIPAIQTFANALAVSVAKSLTLRLEVPWQIKSIDESKTTKHRAHAVSYRLSASGSLEGEGFVSLDRTEVAALGSQLLKQPIVEFDDQQADAFEEVITSAMEGFCSLLSVQFGEVTFKVDRVEDVGLEGMLTVALEASCEDEHQIPLLLSFSERLSTSLSPANDALPPAKVKKTAIDPANLQLVMDVELNVSLRFGQCQLPLRDVLDLASGSVIELDRDVDDPVELLLDGKVIARGEAVIVDGNYGLRITEIPEPIASHFIS
jgi:flagellar motor switch protein FliN/FliY